MMNKYLTFLIVSFIFWASPLLAQSEWPTKEWTLTTPPSVGLDSKVLSALDTDIEQGKYGYLSSLRHIISAIAGFRNLLNRFNLELFRVSLSAHKSPR
jgi:hypothetical protein